MRHETLLDLVELISELQSDKHYLQLRINHLSTECANAGNSAVSAQQESVDRANTIDAQNDRIAELIRRIQSLENELGQCQGERDEARSELAIIDPRNYSADNPKI